MFMYVDHLSKPQKNPYILSCDALLNIFHLRNHSCDISSCITFVKENENHQCHDKMDELLFIGSSLKESLSLCHFLLSTNVWFERWKEKDAYNVMMIAI